MHQTKITILLISVSKTVYELLLNESNVRHTLQRDITNTGGVFTLLYIITVKAANRSPVSGAVVCFQPDGSAGGYQLRVSSLLQAPFRCSYQLISTD